ncbi:hypothetical protein P7C70_g6174, partial [Phenoliferia sp. Uapishka_3]
MHFTNREVDVTRSSAGRQPAQFQHSQLAPAPQRNWNSSSSISSSSNQGYNLSPNPTPYPVQPFPSTCLSSPPAAHFQTFQRPLPPTPFQFTQPPLPASPRPPSELRHPKSYYSQFRNLPTLGLSSSRRGSTHTEKSADEVFGAPDVEEPEFVEPGVVEDYQVQASDQETGVKGKKVVGKKGREKRHRKTLSCEPCRKKVRATKPATLLRTHNVPLQKIRCDRNIFCGPCKIRGIECIWSAHSAPNMPRDSASSNPDDLQIIEHLRAQVRKLGGELQMEASDIEKLLDSKSTTTSPSPAPRLAPRPRTRPQAPDPHPSSSLPQPSEHWPSPRSQSQSQSPSGSSNSANSSPEMKRDAGEAVEAPLMVLEAFGHMGGAGDEGFEWYGARDGGGGAW